MYVKLMFQFVLMCNKPSPNLLCSQSLWVRNLGRVQRDGLSPFHTVCVSAGKSGQLGKPSGGVSAHMSAIYTVDWLGYQLGLLTRAPTCSLLNMAWASLQHGGLRVVGLLT